MSVNDALQLVLDSLSEMPASELPHLLGELEVIRVTALMRLSAPAPILQHDELIPVEAAAARLGVSTDYLYRHASSLPFTRRQGRKLLFSSLGVDAYIRGKNVNNVLTARQHKRILALSGGQER